MASAPRARTGARGRQRPLHQPERDHPGGHRRGDAAGAPRDGRREERRQPLCAGAADEGPEGLVLPPDAWDRLRGDWSDADIEDGLVFVRDSLMQSELVEASDNLSARLVELLYAALSPLRLLPPVPQLAACSSHQFAEMINANEANQKLFVDRYLEEGLTLDQAVVQGSIERLAPVLMTALCAGLALVIRQA